MQAPRPQHPDTGTGGTPRDPPGGIGVLGELYLGDRDDGEDVPLAEGQVLLGGAVEVVLGDALRTGRPHGLGGGPNGVGVSPLFGGRPPPQAIGVLLGPARCSPASLTSSQGGRGRESHGRDTSLGTMRPTGGKGLLRRAPPPGWARRCGAQPCGVGSGISAPRGGFWSSFCPQKSPTPTPKCEGAESHGRWSTEHPCRTLRGEESPARSSPRINRRASHSTAAKRFEEKRIKSHFPQGKTHRCPGRGCSLVPRGVPGRAASCPARGRGTSPALSSPAGG